MFWFQNVKDMMSPLMMYRHCSTDFLADERESGQVCGSTRGLRKGHTLQLLTGTFQRVPGYIIRV